MYIFLKIYICKVLTEVQHGGGGQLGGHHSIASQKGGGQIKNFTPSLKDYVPLCPLRVYLPSRRSLSQYFHELEQSSVPKQTQVNTLSAKALNHIG